MCTISGKKVSKGAITVKFIEVGHRESFGAKSTSNCCFSLLRDVRAVVGVHRSLHHLDGCPEDDRTHRQQVDLHISIDTS